MKSYCVLLVVVVIPILVSAQCETGEMRSHPELCERYLVCHNDVFVEMLCPSELFFNPELNVCDWPNNVNCTSTSTTTAPTTTTTTTQTTISPTTISPTTISPTTISPTTISPTTISPTTTSPTTTTHPTTTAPPPTTTSPPTTTTTRRTTTTTPPPTTVTVPLYRLFHSILNNHFYTTSEYESNNAVYNLGYVLEGIAGFVSVSPGGCQLAPVYRLLKETNNFHNHFYTTNAYEASLAESAHGYKPEGTPFYCAANSNICGASTPFYRYNRKSGHHFYTTNLSEGNNVIVSGGTFEGIMCYIWT